MLLRELCSCQRAHKIALLKLNVHTKYSRPFRTIVQASVMDSFRASSPVVLPLDGPVVVANSGRPGGGRTAHMLILSEFQLYREALAAAVALALDFARVHAAATLGEIDVGVLAVVLIDAALSDAITLASYLHRHNPSTCLIVCYVDDKNIDVTAWAAVGITGYIDRSFSLAALLDLIAGAVNRLPPDGTSTLAGQPSKLAIPSAQVTEARKALAGLTKREKEVVRLILSGESNKGIARSLRISLPTVKSHVHNVLGKLGLERRGKLAQWQVLSALVPASIADPMKDETFQAASNRVRTVVVRRRKWNLLKAAETG
jgi:two-component system, NarL family, nitrate/nitrite response regulator NarL